MVKFFFLGVHGRFQQQHAGNRNDQKQAGIPVRKKLRHGKKFVAVGRGLNRSQRGGTESGFVQGGGQKTARQARAFRTADQ